MRNTRAATLGAIAAFATTGAAANELSGPYAGVGAGVMRIEDSSHPFSIVATPIPDLFFGSIDGSDAAVAAVAGYRWEIGRLVLGVEADVEKSSVGAGRSSALAGLNVDADWSGSIRLVGGAPLGPALVYATYGGATGAFDFAYRLGASPPTVLSEELSGWTAGVGVEWSRPGRMRPRIEYRTTDYSDFSHDPAIFRFDHKLKTSSLRVSMVMQLGQGG